MFSTIFTSFLFFLASYRYFALGTIIFIGSLTVPLPDNMVMMAAGAFSKLGQMNLILAFLVSYACNVVADSFGFYLAHRYGERVLKKFGFTDSNINKWLSNKLKRHATITIFVTRIVGPFDALVNILSGLYKIPYKTFILYDLLGNFVDVSIYMLAGYIIGTFWRDLYDIVNNYAFVLVIIIVLIYLLYIYIKNKLEAKMNIKL